MQPLHAGARAARGMAAAGHPARHRAAVLLGVRTGVRSPRHRPQEGERLHRRRAPARLRGAAILPHEKVLKGPLEDRIRLTEATNTQFEYIWSIYQDRAYVIDNILDEQEKESPIVDYVEQPIGVRHRLWRLTDTGKCDIIRRTMARQKIYIADGHHRYQTMLTIRDRMRQRFPDAGPDAPWEFIMMFLVNAEHEGLTVLPTHRMLHGIQVESLFKLGADILEHFHVKKYVFRDGDEPEVRRRWLRDLRDVEQGEHTFGAYIINTNGYYLLTLRDEEAYEELVQLDYLLGVEAPRREHPQHADSRADPRAHRGTAEPFHEHLLHEGRR